MTYSQRDQRYAKYTLKYTNSVIVNDRSQTVGYSQDGASRKFSVERIVKACQRNLPSYSLPNGPANELVRCVVDTISKVSTYSCKDGETNST